jgi:Na+-driven multidrug efflux pump
VLSPTIFSAFSKDDTPFFIEHGSRIFRLISLGFLLIGFQIILGSVYQSFGYPIRAMLVALSRQALLFFPIALLFISLFELEGLWYTFAAADLIAGFICMIAMIYELRVIHKKTKGFAV